jgi:hypothetical protein
MEAVKVSDETTPAAPLVEHKVKIAPTIHVSLSQHAEEVGFHSANTLSAIVLTAFADVPANKTFEALAMLRRYGRKKGTK